MRLWSLHPQYLDSKGLVACWREGLLARKVLLGETRGYTNHPQLERFRVQKDPVEFIDAYLNAICDEAERRGYNFDRNKLGASTTRAKMRVTSGQVAYEWHHLKEKLKLRDPRRLSTFDKEKNPAPHPLFRIVAGDTESWERIA